jgi:hypothetical protein
MDALPGLCHSRIATRGCDTVARLGQARRSSGRGACTDRIIVARRHGRSRTGRHLLARYRRNCSLGCRSRRPFTTSSGQQGRYAQSKRRPKPCSAGSAANWRHSPHPRSMMSVG